MSKVSKKVPDSWDRAFIRLSSSLSFEQGPSMRPTLNPEGSFFRDTVLIKILDSNEANNLQVGDIVFVRRKSRRLIKRISEIGNTEETTVVSRCQPGYCWLSSDASDGKEGHYYFDSSVFGQHPLSEIAGVATHVVFPPHRFRRLSRSD